MREQDRQEHLPCTEESGVGAGEDDSCARPDTEGNPSLLRRIGRHLADAFT